VSLEQLIEQLLITKDINWNIYGALFSEHAIGELLEHQTDMISKDCSDDAGIVNWVAAEEAVIYLAKETTAFQVAEFESESLLMPDHDDIETR